MIWRIPIQERDARLLAAFDPLVADMTMGALCEYLEAVQRVREICQEAVLASDDGGLAYMDWLDGQ